MPRKSFIKLECKDTSFSNKPTDSSFTPDITSSSLGTVASCYKKENPLHSSFLNVTELSTSKLLEKASQYSQLANKSSQKLSNNGQTTVRTEHYQKADKCLAELIERSDHDEEAAAIKENVIKKRSELHIQAFSESRVLPAVSGTATFLIALAQHWDLLPNPKEKRDLSKKSVEMYRTISLQCQATQLSSIPDSLAYTDEPIRKNVLRMVGSHDPKLQQAIVDNLKPALLKIETEKKELTERHPSVEKIHKELNKLAEPARNTRKTLEKLIKRNITRLCSESKNDEQFIASLQDYILLNPEQSRRLESLSIKDLNPFFDTAKETVSTPSPSLKIR